MIEGGKYVSVKRHVIMMLTHPNHSKVLDPDFRLHFRSNDDAADNLTPVFYFLLSTTHFEQACRKLVHFSHRLAV